LNILVIEDHPSELKLANHVLTAAGHQVNGLEAADTALETIYQNRPDLIVLDMQLPGMDSLDLVRSLKSDPSTAQIIIVAVTSFPETYPKAKAIKAGCDAYIVKPLSTRTLPNDLDVILHAQGSRPNPQ